MLIWVVRTFVVPFCIIHADEDAVSFLGLVKITGRMLLDYTFEVDRMFWRWSLKRCG